jgi:YgiT-type zinc finger domain-containing protein
LFSTERCPCGGEYTEQMTQINIDTGSGVVALSHVAQFVCQTCGSRVYKAGELELIEAVLHQRPLA